MLFNCLEKHPLTEKQEQACQSTAMTTLVLAGAGTGKTSTLMGRMVYLWETQQTTPEEVLPLAFAVDAAHEIQRRVERVLQTHFSAKDIDKNFKSRTFHSLGRYIVQCVEGESPCLTPYQKEEELMPLLQQQFDKLVCEDEDYRRLLFMYFTFYEGDATEFGGGGRSLNDDYVLHPTELVIANLLYLLGIPYIFHAHYKYNLYVEKKYHPYRCSFYLPQSDCYIEVVSDKDKSQYQNIHQQYGTRCIFIDESWGQCVLQQGVNFYHFNMSIPIAHSKGRVDNLLAILQRLFLTIKANGVSSDDLEKKSSWRSYQSILYALVKPLYRAYENLLQERREIDFDAMILKATQYIKEKRFLVPWKEVLIDEFQDISLARLALIQAMREQKPHLRLFCVGDDWQTIYQFAGSKLAYIRYVESYFGETHIIALDKTFRFHPTLCEISSRFIQQNPMQYRKILSAQGERQEGIVLVEDNRKGGIYPGRYSFDDWGIKAILDEIVYGASTASCLFLARFQHDLPTVNQLMQWQRKYPQLLLQAKTIHASKGMEADFVIILNVNRGLYGLPSEKEDNSLSSIDYDEPQIMGSNQENALQQETFPHAQERRVFYVALTRARYKVYLRYHSHSPSPFIEELLSYQSLRRLNISTQHLLEN